jgi:AraC-like DNA-binding protein
MPPPLSDFLLRDFYSDRSDVILLELCSDAAIQIPKHVSRLPVVPIVHFVLDGLIQIEVENMGSPIELHPGECGVLGYGDRHRIYIDPSNHPARDHLITEWPSGDEPLTVRVGTGEPAAKFISAAVHIVHLLDRQASLHVFPEIICLKHEPKPPHVVRTLFADTTRIKENCQGPGANAFINALMNLHIAHYMRHLFNQLKSRQPIEKAWFTKIRQIEAATRMLRKHPEKEWTVANLAKEVGYSRSLFATMFQAQTGVGPMRYLRNLRMERAAELLRSTPELPVLTVARRVGYDTINSFDRAFKAHFALSPRTFSERRGMQDRVKVKHK